MDTPKKRKAKRGHRGDTSSSAQALSDNNSSERADRNHRDRQERLSFVHYFYSIEQKRIGRRSVTARKGPS